MVVHKVVKPPQFLIHVFVSAVNTSHRKVTKVREVKWEGFWTSLQPKNPESLYYKLMKQPGEVEVQRWLCTEFTLTDSL